MIRSASYGFPEAAIDPGEEHSAKIDVRGVFRAQKLLMVGMMDEVRGSFWIKRSRLPRLDRNNIVTAYTKIIRRRRRREIYFAKGRTIVRYEDAERSFERKYLWSSVVYEPVDPLSYIRLRNVFIGSERQMPDGGGAPAEMFGVNVLGNGLPFSSTSAAITLLLKNEGDIRVRVRAAVFGVVS